MQWESSRTAGKEVVVDVDIIDSHWQGEVIAGLTSDMLCSTSSLISFYILVVENGELVVDAEIRVRLEFFGGEDFQKGRL